MDPSIQIQSATWESCQETLRDIRTRVFIQEQGVPEDLEWDEQDPASRHWLVWRDGLAIATARLTPQGQIGRMAVLAEWRHQGIGTRLLDTIVSSCRNDGISVFLNAQLSAHDFYLRNGFNAQGAIFTEAGIPHVRMIHERGINRQ